MTFTYRYYKTENNKWYVDIPVWEGSVEDLEMVCGADIMLNIISKGENEIYLAMSDKKLTNGSELIKIKNTPKIGGAEYSFNNWIGIDYNVNVWLSGVIEWIFGYLPNVIYII